MRLRSSTILPERFRGIFGILKTAWISACQQPWVKHPASKSHLEVSYATQPASETAQAQIRIIDHVRRGSG